MSTYYGLYDSNSPSGVRQLDGQPDRDRMLRGMEIVREVRERSGWHLVQRGMFSLVLRYGRTARYLSLWVAEFES